ncbi:helix-turn-helix transcriptional regulator [Hydrogenophaga palleronii]|uniref:helix-turn-helix transcriptional regulator n=1 Tax=Hydrogenophaga palleronii TaxID=65655 RepID=UPI00082604D3|nr:YafY family protein [Hydrogenophaga palleronii]
MRRADRLFALVQLIRGRRLSTAAWLAARLEVSPRTVYRDVADLQARGVPIEGEAGVGYRLGKGFDLPPLMFTQEEARALALATQMARQWLDPALALAASDAMSRVLSVLPPRVRTEVESQQVVAVTAGLDLVLAERLQLLRESAQQRRRIGLRYRDQDDRQSERQVWPLGCFFWGKVWTLAAWCEQRQDFRSFRLDRMVSVEPSDERFPDEPGKRLADLLRRETGRSTLA